jgi:hypothetical protein
VVDVRSGLASNRVEGTASLSEKATPTVLFSVTAGAMQSLPILVSDPYPITMLTGSVETRVGLDRQVDVGIGCQAFWQDQTGYGTIVSAIGFVTVTARAPTLHF